MVEIKGAPAPTGDKDRRKVIVAFNAARPEYWGFSGCTDAAGRFVKNGAPLPAASDGAAQTCKVDEQIARAMKSALQDTRSYRVTPTTLELLNAKGERVAKMDR